MKLFRLLFGKYGGCVQGIGGGISRWFFLETYRCKRELLKGGRWTVRVRMDTPYISIKNWDKHNRQDAGTFRAEVGGN